MYTILRPNFFDPASNEGDGTGCVAFTYNTEQPGQPGAVVSEVHLHCPSLSNANPPKVAQSFTSHSLSNSQTRPSLQFRSLSGNEVIVDK